MVLAGNCRILDPTLQKSLCLPRFPIQASSLSALPSISTLGFCMKHPQEVARVSLSSSWHGTLEGLVVCLCDSDLQGGFGQVSPSLCSDQKPLSVGGCEDSLKYHVQRAYFRVWIEEVFRKCQQLHPVCRQPFPPAFAASTFPELAMVGSDFPHQRPLSFPQSWVGKLHRLNSATLSPEGLV